MKRSIARSSLGIFFVIALLAARANAANLTAVMVFSCDAEGNPAGDFVWDTRGLDSDFYKVWLTRGAPGGAPDGLTGSFLNGPSWGGAPINLNLDAGANQFTMFFQHNGRWEFFAVNFFFDGNSLPAISVKAPIRSGRETPQFTANSAHRTYSLTSYPAPNTPAAGTLAAVLDRRVELTDYYVATSNLFNLDRVSTHSVGSNDRLDYVGTFTLTIGPRPRDTRIQIHITEVTVCWESETGRNYQLQYRAASETHGWMNIGAPVAGTGEQICVKDQIPLGEGQRFYRVTDVP